MWLLAERVDLARVRALVAVAGEGSFTAAAEKLFLSQPWLSTQVRELESRVGVELLDRSHEPIVPTEAGERLLPLSRVLLRRTESAAQAVQLAAQAAGSPLQVGAPAHTWDVPARRRIIHRLLALDPAVQLTVRHGESHALIEDVRRGALDAAFAVLPIDDHGLDVLVIDESSVWVQVPDDNPIRQRTHLTPRDLAGQRVGVWDRRVNPLVYDMVYEPLRAAGAVLIPLPGIRMEGAREAAIRASMLSVDRVSFGGRPRPIPGAAAVPLDLGRSIVTALVARSGERGHPGLLARLWSIAEDERATAAPTRQ